MYYWVALRSSVSHWLCLRQEEGKGDTSKLPNRMSELETVEAFFRTELENKEKQWMEEKMSMVQTILKLEQDLVHQQTKKNNVDLQPSREQVEEEGADKSEVVEDLEELRKIEVNEATLRAELEDKTAQEWRTRTELLLQEKANMEQTLTTEIQHQQEKAARLEKGLEKGRRELHELSQQCAVLQQTNRELQLSRECVEVELRGQVCSRGLVMCNCITEYSNWMYSIVHVVIPKSF